MRADEPAQHKGDAKGSGQADEDGLREAAHDGDGVDAVEDGRGDDAGEGVQQAHGAEQLARAVGGDVLRERGLQGGAAHAAEGGDGARGDEHAVRVGGRVADVADDVEDDGDAHDGEVELVGAGVALRGARGGPAHEADGERQDDDQDGDAAGVDDREEDGLVVGVEVEAVAGVDEHDSHGAHGDPEHGRVDGGEEDEVAAHGAGRAGAGGPEDAQRREEPATFGDAAQEGGPCPCVGGDSVLVG